jgi:hypothetical protein
LVKIGENSDYKNAPSFFPGKNYISLDWHPKAKELFYSEKAAEDFAQGSIL